MRPLQQDNYGLLIDSKDERVPYLKKLLVLVTFTQGFKLSHCMRMVVAILRVNVEALFLYRETEENN